MTKLKRTAQSTFTDDTSMRLRAAWLYHGQDLTQNEVAKRLGIGRSTTIRLLEEAKKRGEVRIWIEEGVSELVELALKLETAFDLDEVIVVPASNTADQTAKSVGLALGKFLSETISDNMTIGVGWGRTLTSSLASFHPAHHTGIKVMSLLGGSVETHFANPVEFAWRIANTLDAECYLFPAPVFVDSAATKEILIKHCGLEPIFQMAQKLDLAIVSAGDINTDSTSLVRNFISARENEELLKLGCVGEVMCNFLDAQGNLVAHSLNERVMSIGLDTLKSAIHLVLASGGASRAQSIFAAIKNINCNTLVTDEAAAMKLLKMSSAS